MNKENKIVFTTNYFEDITAKEVELANEKGISKEVIKGRCYQGFNKYRALNKPVKGTIITSEIAKILKENNIKQHTFRERIRRGWDLETALHKKVNRKYNKGVD